MNPSISLNSIQGNPQLQPSFSSKDVYRYPFMDKEHINRTIQNAKKIAHEYNQLQEEKSSSINLINKELLKSIKKDPHTIAQKVKFQEFKVEKGLKTAPPEHYNHEVLQFNRANGTHFLMRKYKPIKNEVVITLPFLVVFYAAQIRDRNARRLNSGITTTGTLPRLLTNSESLKRYKIDGVKQCPYHNSTILAHVHALVDAGILIDYKNHGRNMGFSVLFNPEILAIGDVKKGKLQPFENKRFTFYKNGIPSDSGLVTGTQLNNNKNKGDAKAPLDNRNATKVASKNHENTTENNYKTTRSVKNPEKDERFLNKKLAENSSSLKIEQEIQETWPLCQELEQNIHIHHVPKLEELENEAAKGTMSQHSFRILLFQQFLKYVSRLKSKNQSAAGAFYKALEELMDKKMVNFAGRLYSKPLMFAEFSKWLWMVDHAERWGKKRNWNFLFINDYLDTQRRDAKEMGFWYLEKQWNANEKKKKSRKVERSKNREAHLERKKKIKISRLEKYGYRSVKVNERSKTDFEKAQIHVRKYLYGKINFEELYRYLETNTNYKIIEGLSSLIESERKSLTRFNA